MSGADSYQERVRKTLEDLGIPLASATRPEQRLQQECQDLVSIGPDMFGREQQLERQTAAHWQAMATAARQDGVALMVVSGFRSFDHQRKIIERKLAAGLALEEIIRVSALPGYSEHHTGQAVDIGTPGCPPVTEQFEQTPAFDWLTRRGNDFGFGMTYPRDNRFGIIYEPWHWRFVRASAR